MLCDLDCLQICSVMLEITFPILTCISWSYYVVGWIYFETLLHFFDWVMIMIGSFLSSVYSAVGLDFSSTVIGYFKYCTRTMMYLGFWNSMSTYCFSSLLNFLYCPLALFQNHLLLPWSSESMIYIMGGLSDWLVCHVLCDPPFLHLRCILFLGRHFSNLIRLWIFKLKLLLNHHPCHCFTQLVGPFPLIESWIFFSKQCWIHTLFLIPWET